MSLFGRIARWAREAVAWGVALWHVLGWLGLASLVSGLAISVGGVVWAVITGIPIPIAIMAGYCTFVGAVYLTMAPAAFRLLAKNPTTGAAHKDEPPNYEAWKHVDKFTLPTAAHLWCDIDPDAGDTYDTRAWARAFASAVQRGELKTISVSGGIVVTRAALKDFAKLHKYDKRFLRD
jgi:hypothetical protein